MDVGKSFNIDSRWLLGPFTLRNEGETMPDRITEQDRKDYDVAMREYHEAEVEQHEKDAAVMCDVKKRVSIERYASIESEIENSEKAYNYRIVQNPMGEPYIGDHGIRGWVDQRAVGLSGDSWVRSVCVEISSHEYLMWDFEV